MVGVLGPEFTLGSGFYHIAKSLTTDLVAAGLLAVDDPPTLLAMAGAPSLPTGGDSSAHGGLTGVARPGLGFEALACELQAVLFAQQVILFAPADVAGAKHVPMLAATLLSRRPALRGAAAGTLFHLSERDPSALLPTRIEGAVIAALDNETITSTCLIACLPARLSGCLLACSASLRALTV
jgi:hypothetical protein